MDDPDAYALDLLTRHAPQFLKQVNRKRLNPSKDPVIEISLDQFENSPLVLYAALHYAGRQGITVAVLPVGSAA